MSIFVTFEMEFFFNVLIFMRVFMHLKSSKRDNTVTMYTCTGKGGAENIFYNVEREGCQNFQVSQRGATKIS